MCVSRELESCRCLTASLLKSGIKPERLVIADGICIGINLDSDILQGLLPKICEHSDTVCIGRFYPEIFAEHGINIAGSEILSILSFE